MIYTVAIGTTLIKVSSISRVEVLDETLDYASITIAKDLALDSKLMKEVVTITVNDNSEIRSYYFLIDSDISEPIDRDNNLYNRHEISLIELTSRLSDYTVGYRKFTNDTDTLFDILKDLIDTMFWRNSFISEPSRIVDISLTHSSLNPLKLILGRDFRFDNNTLREAIDSIFYEVGGIPRIIFENGSYKLTLDKMNERKTLRTILANSEANYKQTHNITKYGTVMESYTDNQVFDKTLAGASISEPSTIGFMPVTTESAVVNSDNSIWKTIYPIREIVKFELEVLDLSGAVDVLDITNRVVHEDVFNGLDITNFFNIDYSPDTTLILTVEPTKGTVNITTLEEYDVGTKQGSLYYKGNVIQNLYTIYGGSWGEEVIKSIIDSAFYDKYGTTADDHYRPYAPPASTNNSVFENLRARITYVPLFDSALQVERYNTDDINKYTMMQTNQSASVISTEKALNKMGTLLNSLGNKEITTSSRLTLLDNEFEVGDYTSDNYILAKKEVIYFKNHFDVIYQWDKDYQKRNEDVEVSSELRLTAISKNVSDRKLTYKEYVYIGFTGLTSETTLLRFIGKEIFTNLIEKSSTYNTSIKNAFVTNEDVLTIDNPLLLPVISSGGRNVLNFNFGFQSPNVAGTQFDTTTETIPILVPIEYTDTNGEMEYINWELLDTVAVTDPKTLPIVPRINKVNKVVGSLFDRYMIKKDSAETISMAYQLHLIPNKNIIIGDYFVTRNNLIETKSSFEDLVVYSSTEFYTPNETRLVKGTLASGVTVVRTSNELITISATINNAAWGIATTSGELLFAVNQFTATQTTIELSYFNARYDINYDFLGEQIVSDPPASPTGYSGIALSDTEINISWDDNSSDETYFLLKISDDGITFTNLDIVDFDVTSYSVIELEPATKYWFEIYSYNTGGTNNIPATGTTTTEPTPVPPTTPTGYIVTAGSTTVLNASWNASANTTSYTIEIKKTVDSVWTAYQISSSFTTYQFTGLSVGTSYDTRIKANNAQGSSGYATYTVSTDDDPDIITDAPTIGGVNPDTTSVIFDVTNNDSSTATIYVDYNDSTPDRDSASIISGGTHSFTFTGLTQGTTYTLYAKAQASGESLSPYHSKSFTTDTEPTAPNAPSSFTGSEGFQELIYAWTDNSDNEDNFVIELHTNSSFSALFDSVTKAANSTSHVFDVTQSGSYWARIKAVNGVGSSAWVACTDNPLGIA